jgi:hypothetical protein
VADLLQPTRFRRVQARVAFVPGREARVYGSGSACARTSKVRAICLRAGARWLTATVDQSRLCRQCEPDASLKPLALPDDAVDIVGALRWPEPPHWFVSLFRAARPVVHARPSRHGGALWLGEVAPFISRWRIGAGRRRAAAGAVARSGATIISLRHHLVRIGRSLLAVFGVWAPPF